MEETNKIIDVEVKEVEDEAKETPKKTTPEIEAEKIREQENAMLSKLGCLVYYDDKLADLDRIRISSRMYSLVNPQKNSFVIYKGSVMKINGLDAALAVQNVMQAIYKQRFDIVETNSIIGMNDGIII